MEILLERWCQSRPWYRGFCGCLAALCLGLSAWGMWLRPVQIQRAALKQQVAEARKSTASLWPAAIRVPRQETLPEAPAASPFSPLDFQSGETRLVHWKPLQRGGELTLDADWQAIPAVFARLAQRDVRVTAFVLSPQETVLRLRVLLEYDDAQ